MQNADMSKILGVSVVFPPDDEEAKNNSPYGKVVAALRASGAKGVPSNDNITLCANCAKKLVPTLDGEDINAWFTNSRDWVNVIYAADGANLVCHKCEEKLLGEAQSASENSPDETNTAPDTTTKFYLLSKVLYR